MAYVREAGKRGGTQGREGGQSYIVGGEYR